MTLSCDDGPLPRWVETPDPPSNVTDKMYRGLTMQDFLAQSVVSMDLAGNAFWSVSRNSAGRVQAVWCLDPQYVTFHWDRMTGRYRFVYNQNHHLEICLLYTSPSPRDS